MPRFNRRHGIIIALLVVIAGIFAIGWHRESGELTALQEAERARGERQLHGAQVAMIGDSITSQGGDWSMRLGVPVANLGISGARSGEMLRQAESLPPTIGTALVMGGINDLLGDVPPATIVANLRAVLAKLGARRIFLQSVLVTDDAATNRRVAALNTALAGLCESGQCRFIDLNPVIAPSGILDPTLTSDGLHLSEPAYRRWAAHVAPMVKRSP